LAAKPEGADIETVAIFSDCRDARARKKAPKREPVSGHTGFEVLMGQCLAPPGDPGSEQAGLAAGEGSGAQRGPPLGEARQERAAVVLSWGEVARQFCCVPEVIAAILRYHPEVRRSALRLLFPGVLFPPRVLFPSRAPQQERPNGPRYRWPPPGVDVYVFWHKWLAFTAADFQEPVAWWAGGVPWTTLEVAALFAAGRQSTLPLLQWIHATFPGSLWTRSDFLLEMACEHDERQCCEWIADTFLREKVPKRVGRMVTAALKRARFGTADWIARTFSAPAPQLMMCGWEALVALRASHPPRPAATAAAAATTISGAEGPRPSDAESTPTERASRARTPTALCLAPDCATCLAVHCTHCWLARLGRQCGLETDARSTPAPTTPAPALSAGP
jgi:hypothetical protein